MRTDNLLHRSVAVIVTTTDGRLVVQHRSEDKDLFPGWWDIGAGGVVTAGEDRALAARRELAEELGVDADPSFVGVGRHDDEHAREICWIYRAVSDGPFHPVDGEVTEILAVDPDEFLALSSKVDFLPGSLALLLPHASPFLAHTSCGDRAERRLRCIAVQRVEFTIEPFVEAAPGDHVTAPVEALRSLGVGVEVGPFGSSCRVPSARVGDVVATICRIAVEHGATHINVDVEAVDT